MKWYVLVVATIALTLLTTQGVAGYRILFISAIASKSQKGYFTIVANKLADHGHQVTLVSPYKPSKVKENIREIVLNDLDISSILPNLFEGDSMAAPMRVMSKCPAMCSDALSRKEVQDLLNEEFDVGMISSMVVSDCFLTLFHQLKIPFIHVNPAGLVGTMGIVMGNPSFPSFTNSPFGDSFHPLTFTQRISNAIMDVITGNIMAVYVLPKMESVCRSRGLCPDDMPNLSELKSNASLMLVNGVRTMETPPRPVFPSIVHIGGIHCHESKPLSKDLEEWVAGAGDDGFIFFSLGSVVKPSTMPEEYRKIFVTAFGSLKQRVLWKWDEDTMEDLPPNVRLGKWLPQQDILGHSRLRLFITHGGALSTQESMYHGTPVIGLPVFSDQMTNMVETQNHGWGRVLKWKELSVDLLKDTILDVMTNTKFQQEVKRKSSLMRDQSMNPTQTAIYWTEYVVRHKGAKHLRSPTLDMTWYQIYNVDVWLTILGLLVVVLFLVFKLILTLFRCCFSSKSTKTKRE